MFIGVDVGTSGTKTIIISEDGELLSESYRSYGFTHYKGVLCQDPNEWKRAIIQTVNECLELIDSPTGIRGMGFSFQSGTMIPIDEYGRELMPAILWLDNGAGEQARLLQQKKGRNFFYEKTGWMLPASFNLVQIQRLRDEEPEVFSKVKRFAHVSDYLLEWLCGEPAVDYSSAGNGMLFNIREKRWDQAILELIDIQDDQLGRAIPSGVPLGYLRPNIAHELGLDETVEVFSGAQDQFCSAAAAGIIDQGDILLSTGTSWVFMAVSNEPFFQTRLFPPVNNHIVNNRYVSYLYIPTGGTALNWFRRSFNFNPNQLPDYSKIDERAALVEPGADGLIFINHLSGTLYPDWKTDAKGAFIGASLAHGYEHFARALMEGVAFEYAVMVNKFESECPFPLNNTLTALGGATKSDLWMQIVANVLNKPIKRIQMADIAPYGAALLAAIGCGQYRSFREANTNCSLPASLILPSFPNREIYQEKLAEYEKLASQF